MWDLLNYDWPEVKAYLDFKEFVVRAFAQEFTRQDLLELKTWSHRAVAAILSLKPNGMITCKAHHLLHYHQLIALFGPLIHFSTHHYERHHQISKCIARNTKNFKAILITIDNRHQARKAWFESTTKFTQRDFYPCVDNDTDSRVVLHDSPPSKYVHVTSKNRPFKLGHGISRKIRGRGEQWFYTEKFLRDSNERIWCKGKVFAVKKSKVGNSWKSEKRGSLFLMKLEKNESYILFKDLKLAGFHNDYIFVKNNFNYLVKMRY